jgi:ABC-type nitrate/sulfonate/bicarbonate transport system permease component/ABC-type nitrate/sulfonate/bicarbonate transport system substrate-binding protein
VRRAVAPWLGGLAALATWQLVASTGVLDPAVFPGPLAVARAALTDAPPGLVIASALTSLGRVATGFVLGAGLGIALGIAGGWYRGLGRLVQGPLELLRPIPPLAWIPLAILWFGLGEPSKVFVIFLGAFFPVLTSTWKGMRGIDPDLLRAGQSLGVRGGRLLARVALPAALPDIAVGLRIAWSLSFGALVAAELIAADRGLGFMIMHARELGRVAVIVYGIILIGAVNLATDRLIAELVLKRQLRWHFGGRLMQPCVLLLLALSFAAMPAAARAQTPEVKTLVLGFGVDPVFAPHIVAMQKGWFREAGFEAVETRTFTAGALAGEALAAGQIHLWTPGNVPPISMRHNGLPIVVLGTNALAYIEKLVVRKDAGVRDPADLARIRIGLLEGSTASAVLDRLVAHYRLDPKKLQVVNLPPPEQLTSLVSNQIQAFLVWNPWPYLALQKADVKIMHTGTVSHFASDDGKPVRTSHTRSLLVASEAFVRKSPNAARAMMRTLLRAQAYVAEPRNRDEVIELISKQMNQPVEQNRALWGDYAFDFSFDERYVEDMKAYTGFLARTGRIKNPMDPLAYTYTGYVAEFQPAAVTVKGTWNP